MALSHRFPTAALAAALLLLFTWPIATEAVGPTGDAALFQQPYQMLVGDFARAGQFLLWNPWTNGGSPDGAEPQIGAFSPIAVGAGLIGGGTTWSFVLLWLGTWCLSAAGFARLARHFGAPRWAQVALALAWCTNGAFVGHAGHTCFVHAFAFLPWMVLLLDEACDRRGAARWRAAASAGAWWGLSALAGYPGLVIVCGLWLLAWAGVRVVASRGERRVKPLAAAGVLALMTAVALAVLSPSYAAFFVEGGGYSARTGALARSIATGAGAERPLDANALEPRALWTLVSPIVAPTAADPATNPFHNTDPTSVGLDAGLGTWMLALIALGAALRGGARATARRGETIALAVLGLVFLGTALGGSLPLRGWLYDLVPPTRWFRHAAFFRVGFLFAVALLAVRGARDLDPRRLANAAAICGALGALGTAAALVALDLWPVELDFVTVSAIAAPALAGALVRVAAHHRRTRVAPAALALVVLVGAWFALRLGAPLLSSDPARMHALDAAHSASLELGSRGFERQLLAPTIPVETAELVLAGDLAAVAAEIASPVGQLFDSANLPGKVPVLAGYTALNNELHHALVAYPALLRTAVGRERVYFAREALHLPSDAATFEAFAAASAGGDVPLVVHDGGAVPTDLEDAVRRARLEHVAFEVERFEPRDLVLALTEPRAESGWLYVTERWASGWRAQVDGVATPVVRAGFLWRAVEVPAGARRVYFYYEPFGWPWLLALSWSALIAVIGWDFAARLTRPSGIDSGAAL